MRSRCPAVALVALLLLTGAAPAESAAAGEAKEKLDKLKKNMPDVLAVWAKGRPLLKDVVPLLRRTRVTGDNEARFTVYLFQKGDASKEEKRDLEPARLLFIYLKYHDGLWTATQFGWSSTANAADAWNEGAYFLLDAIDETAEK